jgi:hypothetical protein
MAGKDGITESIVGSTDTDPRGQRCSRAINAVHAGSAGVFEKLGLDEGEVIAVMAALIGVYAEELDMRTETADVLERWAAMLRSGKTIRWTAAGSA